VIMAGDRQASEGYQVASRRIEKIFKSDDLSGVGIAGAAGPAMEMARLFCGSGSCGVPRPGLGGYVTGTGVTRGCPPPEGVDVVYPPNRCWAGGTL
jgi:hypothetical protein